MLISGTGVTVVTSGTQWYEDLLGPVRSNTSLLQQMWRDAESELDEEPGKQWAIVSVWHEGRWVAAAWAAAVERQDDDTGETYLLCCNNYEVPEWRGHGLYGRAFLYRQDEIVEKRALPARTFVFDQPRPLHERFDWRVLASGVSQEPGLDPHVWFEMRWEPRVRRSSRSESASGSVT